MERVPPSQIISALIDQAQLVEPSRPVELDGGELDRDLAHLPLTDLGNAERFARRNKGKFLHVSAVGWLAWDGRRWAREGAEDLVVRAVHQVARAIQGEAAAIRGTDLDVVLEERRSGEAVLLSDKLAKWGRSSESAQKLASIPKHAAPYLAVQASELDSDPWKLNVLNGTIDIRRTAGDQDPVVFRPHDPADLITKLAGAEFKPDALCPAYDKFLGEVHPAAEMRRFLHQWGGYSLTGETGEQKLCFFYGKGKNGKSTLVDTWARVSGDYCETVPIETFLDQGRGRNAGAATPDLALLPGVRLLLTSEPEKGAKLAEALIKLVTGGEPIQARHLNHDYFKFRPSFKLTMSGNYRPAILGTDEGIWRRVVLVPWSITVEKPDRHLPAQLAAEASGILNRLLDGIRDYLDAGLCVPSVVADATADYRSDSDPLGRFLQQATHLAAGERVQASVFHRVFTSWARAAGEKEWSARGLSLAMKERGHQSIQSNFMWWIDLRLTKSELDFDPSPSAPPRWPGEDE